MQILKIALYHLDGRIRTVNFRPGRLNIITGASRTGKSALLDIVDFCMGRDDVSMPSGIIGKTVAWFGVLWQLDEDGNRAFVGRPALSSRQSSTSKAMLTLGGAALDIPDSTELVANIDSGTMRDQLGARIGLPDARLAPSEGSIRTSYSVGLGASAFYSFQAQYEIANKALLFHRQDEQGVAQTIRDTLPYFLGAIQGDQAERREQLRLAARELRRAEADLQAAINESQGVDLELRSLLEQAHAVGLTEASETSSIQLITQTLDRIRRERPAPQPRTADVDSQDRLRSLADRRFELRQKLGGVLDNRARLLDTRDGESGYASAVRQQAGRLESLGLLEESSNNHHDGTCPVCLQELESEDPTVAQLTGRLTALRDDLESVAAAQPARQKALQNLADEASSLRSELVAIDQALEALTAANPLRDQVVGAESQEFIRGRIDAILGRMSSRERDPIEAKRQAVDAAQARVSALESDLDDEASRERLISVLNVVGTEMTELAQELELEHARYRVRLDLARLTVITDTGDGPVPLRAIGSGANWVGYHLVVHLALHKFFVQQGRPAPRFLMLDQPSQVFYESSNSGENEDHDAVARMLRLLDQFCINLAPQFQIIVSEHADLNEDWFRDAVVERWRGSGLIPLEWASSEIWDEALAEPLTEP